MCVALPCPPLAVIARRLAVDGRDGWFELLCWPSMPPVPVPPVRIISHLGVKHRQAVTKMDALQQLLLRHGRNLDKLWSQLTAINGSFFSGGWGNLGIVQLQDDIDRMCSWPPPQQVQIDWRLLQQGSWAGTPYKLWEGAFRTPCISRIHDALPPESRTGRVQLLLPDGPPRAASARGITARLPLGGRSIGRSSATRTVVSHHHHHHQQQGGAAAATASSAWVSPPRGDDSALLSGAAPWLSSAVLHLAATGDQGFGRRLRLGGPLLAEGIGQLVHESPYYGARRPAAQRGSKLCAVSDLLALGWATIYESLCLLAWLEGSGIATRGISGLSMGGVHAAMTAGLCPRPLAISPLLTPRSAAVAYCDGALAPLMAWSSLLPERDWADNQVEAVVAEASQPVSLLAGARYVLAQQQQLQQQQSEPELDQQAGVVGCNRAGEGGVAAVQQAAALAAVAQAAAAEQAAEHVREQEQQRQGQHHCGGVGDLRQPLESSSTSNTSSSSSSSSCSSTNGESGDPRGWRRQVWRWKKQSGSSDCDASDCDDSSSGSSSSWLGLGARRGHQAPPLDTFRRLRHVLETYTDVTRYPRPVRPDAAVLVAARHDEYVSTASVEALQAHWPGSELRLVPGGHVSAFLLHQDEFRRAVRDSLARVQQPPPPATGAAAAAADGAGSGQQRQHGQHR